MKAELRFTDSIESMSPTGLLGQLNSAARGQTIRPHDDCDVK